MILFGLQSEQQETYKEMQRIKKPIGSYVIYNKFPNFQVLVLLRISQFFYQFVKPNTSEVIQNNLLLKINTCGKKVR